LLVTAGQHKSSKPTF